MCPVDIIRTLNHQQSRDLNLLLHKNKTLNNTKILRSQTSNNEFYTHLVNHYGFFKGFNLNETNYRGKKNFRCRYSQYKYFENYFLFKGHTLQSNFTISLYSLNK